MADSTHEPGGVAAGLSTPELIKLASTQISTLVRDELALARVEMSSKAKHAGVGAGLFGAAGLLAAYGAGGLLVAAGLALALVLPGWAAALVVGAAVLVIAGVLALVGKQQLKSAVPPTPKEAVDGLRADIETVTTAVEEHRHS